VVAQAGAELTSTRVADAPRPPSEASRPGSRGALSIAVGLVAWSLALLSSIVIGRVLLDRGTHIVLPTPPVLGEPVGAAVAGLLAASAVGVALALALPAAAQRLTWRRLLVVASLAALAWWIALALVDGPSGLTRGPMWSTEYLHDVPVVRADPGSFLRTFTDEISRYEIHVRGHPPGMVLLLGAMDAIGLRGAGWEAALVLAAAATAPIAVLVALREVTGEQFARRAMPFLVLAPAAIWIATSADALYMAVAAWSVALLVLATRRRGRAAWTRSVVAGLFGAGALLGSYGMLLVAVIPAAVVVQRRRAGVAVIAAGVAAAALLSLVPLGFWWPDGLRATAHEYQVLDLDRPYGAFLVINLGAWALALGPATFAGLAATRDRRAVPLVLGGVAAALLANVSGLSEGEVERIWLPFGLWVLPAGAALASRRGGARPWLLLQVATAVTVVSLVRTQW
jgi:hypothetical protein